MGACDRPFLHFRVSFSLEALIVVSDPWSLVNSLSLPFFYRPIFRPLVVTSHGLEVLVIYSTYYIYLNYPHHPPPPVTLPSLNPPPPPTTPAHTSFPDRLSQSRGHDRGRSREMQAYCTILLGPRTQE